VRNEARKGEESGNWRDLANVRTEARSGQPRSPKLGATLYRGCEARTDGIGHVGAEFQALERRFEKLRSYGLAR
jgi:hypothetical protein